MKIVTTHNDERINILSILSNLVRGNACILSEPNRDPRLTKQACILQFAEISLSYGPFSVPQPGGQDNPILPCGDTDGEGSEQP